MTDVTQCPFYMPLRWSFLNHMGDFDYKYTAPPEL
jgi:hypothetical protein